MKTIMSIAVALALTGCYATAGGDGRVAGGEAEFRLSLPALLPPMVVVHPGVSVVGDFDEEVFYADGYYWARQDRSWYRSRDHRRGWARVEPRYVPAPIAQAPPGRYRRYHVDARSDGRGDRSDRDDRGHGRPDGDDRR